MLLIFVSMIDSEVSTNTYDLRKICDANIALMQKSPAVDAVNYMRILMKIDLNNDNARLKFFTIFLAHTG